MKNPSKRKEADLLKHYLKIKHAETLQYQTIGITKKIIGILFKSNAKFKVERISIGTNPDTFEPIKIITLIEK